MLYYSINYPKRYSMLVSITLAQSRKIFKELVDAIEPANIIKKKNEQTLEIQLINGSMLYFKSSEQGVNALRGYTINGILILDECSFLGDDILEGVLPMTNVHKAPILMISTPKFKNCFFYRYFQMGLDTTQDKYVSIDWNDYNLSQFLSDEQLNEYKKILPANQFKTEYLGEFLDDDGTVFVGFKDCLIKKDGNINGKVVIGIDWGTGQGQDYTSVSILDSTCTQVDYISFNNLNTTQTIQKLTSIIQDYNNKVGVELVLTESNSIGTPYTELLTQSNINIKINSVATTNKSKEKWVSDLQVAFENNNIKILDDAQQVNEIAGYEMTYNPKTKNVAFNAPQGLHDDAVISLMLSLQAFKLKNNRGKYSIR
jgi:phage FluMu gp28-like protein